MFSVGEDVYAKPPQSSEYQKGKIITSKGDKYKIKFTNGAEHTVLELDITRGRTSRSSTRANLRSGRKSPSRNSPSRRSPSRRSPARSPNTRSRKLPMRTTRGGKPSHPNIENPNGKDIFPRVFLNKIDDNEKPELKFEAEKDSSFESIPSQFQVKDQGGATTRRSARIMASTLKSEQEHKLNMLARNIDRAVSLPVERKSPLYDIPPEGKERGFSVQRDQDFIKKYEDKLNSAAVQDAHIVSEPQEWGGWLGAFVLIFVLPLSIILPQITCTINNCKTVIPKVSMNWRYYLTLKSLLAYTGFLCLVTLVSILPIGKLVDGQQNKNGRLQYRLNGIFCAIICLCIFGFCQYRGLEICEFILRTILQLSISGWLLGTILSISLYIKGSKAPVADLNIYASTNSKIYNFFQGKQINPRFGPIDFKIVLWRTSVIGMLIINASILTKALSDLKEFNIGSLNLAMITSTLQIFYALDMLIFESNLLTSFEVMYEGSGYLLCVAHLLYPFFSTLVTRFHLFNKLLITYQCGFFVLSFFVGYILYRHSNSLKSKFRTNPFGPSFTHLETILTSRGKKLIVSGIWGYVRHPNYLGDIIMQLSIAYAGLTISRINDYIPFYTSVCCIIVLVYRAIRDNARCKKRYGYSWEQYCSRVKYMIFKHVF
ncbi:delta(14)-sterol reductase TM7SF2 isoform X2 [Prorops nasuta]|uniref:delta(14)-sterol reductase TM7SF2 isoform X2 n=1 Tax=Prorops nasuta TaxID=863751 RepID=UPI0034CF251F